METGRLSCEEGQYSVIGALQVGNTHSKVRGGLILKLCKSKDNLSMHCKPLYWLILAWH